MKIRIKDIAEKTGVSVGTVDRVLHNRGQVSEETRKKVLAKVKDLGYEKDILASALASKKAYQFALLIPRAESGGVYWSAPLSGIKRAMNEIGHFNIHLKEYLFDLGDRKSFINAAAEMMGHLPDGLIVAPVYKEEANRVLEECTASNIPYLFIDSAIDGANPVLHVGQDSFQSGYLAARLLCYGNPGKGKFLVVTIDREKENAGHISRRILGFEQFMIDSAHEKKVLKLESGVSQGEVESGLKKALDENPGLAGIFVTNSKADQVAAYLRKVRKNIDLTGYDLTDANIEYLEKGGITFLISQKPEDQGYNALMNLFNHVVLQKKVPGSIEMPIDIVTKENYKHYKKYYYE